MIPKTSAKEKYRTNPIFVALVTTLCTFVRDGLGTLEDIEDAAHLARIKIERERERERNRPLTAREAKAMFAAIDEAKTNRAWRKE